ncbi:MAG: Gfo/Idh/MocA family oxidoreductase, partial [Anaerolineae bacterium]|nr:Gfo/Idh/MocA family oxidoreductase [Anaerolineae bacterium]
SKTYRLGVVGIAHGHVNGMIDRFDALPNVEWVACADTVPAVDPLTDKPGTRQGNVKRAQERTGIPKVYADYREMLDKETFDIIIFCPENAMHGVVAEAIAAKGIHMLTEKPMDASLSGALRMVRAAKANNVKVMVNWPTTWSPSIRAIKTLIDDGVIGDVWEVKWRNGPSMGPLAYNKGDDILTDPEKGASWWHQMAPGGGALLDYCCYGACLSRWFIGEPAQAAIAIKANMTSHYGDGDDNAVITVRFPTAIAILEGTWTTWHSGVEHGPIIYGTKGTIVATTEGAKVYTTRSYGIGEPDQIVEGDPLPEGRATLAEEFIHHIETGEPLHATLGPLFNLQAMAILDAGIRSAASGKMEMVNNETWCIG